MSPPGEREFRDSRSRHTDNIIGPARLLVPLDAGHQRARWRELRAARLVSW